MGNVRSNDEVRNDLGAKRQVLIETFAKCIDAATAWATSGYRDGDQRA
jgi:hypothetical protein